MPEAERELAKLRRSFVIIKLVLIVTFIIGTGTTILTLYSLTPYGAVPSGLSGYGPIASQSTTTASTTFASTTPAQGLEPTPLTLTRISSEAYGYVALFSWIFFAGALIWRGHIRSVWSRSRFSYDTFRLLVRMRGAQTRLRLMHSLNEPRNKLQLSAALGIDWKAVDKHVQALEEKGLIQATMTSGTATFYELTDKGKRALEVLEELSTSDTQSTEQRSV
jgi:predicted transcriptional regulator